MAEERDTNAMIEELASREPGSDETVYEDVDVEELPPWWRRAIEEHEKFGLRPYRPPRFTDGTITPPVINRFESEYDVAIQLRGKNVSPGDDWTVFVDGSPAFDVPRHRNPNGYTVLEMPRETFLERLKAYLSDERR